MYYKINFKKNCINQKKVVKYSILILLSRFLTIISVLLWHYCIVIFFSSCDLMIYFTLFPVPMMIPCFRILTLFFLRYSFKQYFHTDLQQKEVGISKIHEKEEKKFHGWWGRCSILSWESKPGTQKSSLKSPKIYRP